MALRGSHMKCLVFLTLLFSISTAIAEVSPEEVNVMLDQMVKDNVISATEAEKAKVKMKTMTTHQWSDINQTATKVASRSPASVSSQLIDVNKIDLDGAQFKQIQQDIEKIVPKQHQ